MILVYSTVHVKELCLCLCSLVLSLLNTLDGFAKSNIDRTASIYHLSDSAIGRGCTPLHTIGYYIHVTDAQKSYLLNGSSKNFETLVLSVISFSTLWPQSSSQPATSVTALWIVFVFGQDLFDSCASYLFDSRLSWTVHPPIVGTDFGCTDYSFAIWRNLFERAVVRIPFSPTREGDVFNC